MSEPAISGPATGLRLPLTPSQTVGPYLHIVLPWSDGPDVVPPGTAGVLRLVGRVVDGSGDPVTDALIETWQAAPDGSFEHPDDPRSRRRPSSSDFRGFGRCPTDADGCYEIHTVKPAALPAPGGAREAPHLDVSVFARGLLDRLVTRVYFPDEGEANAVDPVLQSVPPERRRTLVAAAEDDGALCFDIVLQGQGETVFFDL